MGLDIYFYRRDKQRATTNTDDARRTIAEALSLISARLLKRLVRHSVGTGKSVSTCLEEALEQYLENEGDCYDDSSKDEIGKVSHMWSFICMFHDVRDSGQKRTLTESEIKEMHKLIVKAMSDVESHFKDNGYSVVHSPFEDGAKSLIIERDGVQTEVLLPWNSGEVDRSLEYEANDVIGNTFYYLSERFELEDGNVTGGNRVHDGWLYRKVIELYRIFNDIMQNTDFKKQKIVMCASW